MEISIKQYAQARGIGKGYIHKLVRDHALHLMPEISEIKQYALPTGGHYYMLVVRPDFNFIDAMVMQVNRKYQ